MRWKPVFSGDMLERARAAIGDIRAALSVDFEADWFPIDATPDDQALLRVTLAHGIAGWAVFHGYDHLATCNPQSKERAQQLIASSVAAANELPMQASLLEGLTGIAWSIEHLTRIGINSPDLEIGGEVDDFLLDVLSGDPEYPEMAGGAAGVGVYALERFPGGRSVELLREVERVLAMTSVSENGCTSWFIAPAMLSARNRRKGTAGHWDLGVAHGNVGIALLLTRMLESNAASSAAVAMLEGVIRFIKQHELAAGAPSRFPGLVSPAYEPQEPSRLGWCYGDLGIALLFVRAGVLLDDDALRQRGIDLAERSAARDPREAGILDACLCHGAAGVGHIFRRLAEVDDAFMLVSRRWLALALEMQAKGKGVAGFSLSYEAVDFDGSIPHVWVTNPGLLLGAAGVGLALLSATSGVVPDWDRLLLLS